jgi:hypothetical protein
LLSGASSVDGIAFEVLTIVRADGPDTVATYDTPTGGLQIPRLQVGNAGAETLAATLQLQSRDPMVFRLDTVRRHFEQQVSPG